MEYKYFVDGISYETSNKCVTGAYIISRIQGFDRGYHLVLQNHGTLDKVMQTQDTIDLSEKEHHLYTCPIGDAMGG